MGGVPRGVRNDDIGDGVVGQRVMKRVSTKWDG